MAATRRGAGPTSTRIAVNLRRIRKQRGMSTYQLADELKRFGWPIVASSITKIESGDRGLTPDDLMALSVALNCSPNRLIMPADLTPDESVAGNVLADSCDMWAWATGERQLHTQLATRRGIRASGVDEAVFAIENQPHHHVAGGSSGDRQ